MPTAGNIVSGQINLNNTETATVSFRASGKNNSPDPAQVNKINLGVRFQDTGKDFPGHVPVIQITFQQERDKWNASETLGLASTATSTTQVRAGKLVTTKTVTNRHVKQTTSHSRRAAKAEMNTITNDALRVLSLIQQGKPVYVETHPGSKKHTIVTQ